MLQYQELNEKIKKDLKSKGYTNKAITYEEFLQLYSPYKTEMSEKDFGNILGISRSSYRGMKLNTSKAIILKTDRVDEKQKQEIRKKFIEEGFANRLIDYVEFLKLYDSYKTDISEKDFRNILGISESSYSKMKLNKTRAKILKTGKIKDNIKDEITKDLIVYMNLV